LVVKIPAFLAEDSKIDEVISRARHREALILDVRGNPGGSEELLLHLIAGIFSRDVKVAERRGRKEQKIRIAKSRGDQAFNGKLVVLIDSASASAAEMLARTVQLEKRGTVIGDRSSGSVMEAKISPYGGGVGEDFSYGFEVTVADLIMADGKTLEHAGVTPDELLLPSAYDMAAGRDPVLAGGRVRWRKNDIRSRKSALSNRMA